MDIEPEPGAFNQQINQQGQTVHGNVLTNTGAVSGPMIGGNVGQIGDRNITRNVNTGGGTYAERDINVSGGDFVGRDRVNVSGGFYQPGWTVTGNVNQSLGDLTQYFAALDAAVRTAPAENRQQAQAAVEVIKTEAAKGDKADDDKVAGQVEDLAALVPGAVEALIGLLTSSALGKLAGGATKYVLGRLRRR